MDTIEPTRARPSVRPRISVVVPAYNYARFLTECVRSVLAQEDVDLDVLIIDDASSDDTAEVALELARTDDRVKVIVHEQNKGHIDTFNEGLFAVDGTYVVLLDADDLLPVGSLARATALLEARPDVGFVSGWPVSFTGEPPDVPVGEVKSWSIWTGHDWDAARCESGYNCISTPEIVMRASVMRETGGMKASLPHTADFELWMQLAARSNVGRINGPPQGYYRIHSESMLRSSFAESVIDLAQRRDAFASLFAGPAGEWPDADLLHDTARRKLADQALGRASRAYERGRTDEVAVDELIRFAFDVWPNAQQLPEWRALTRRRRVGPQVAKIMPPFVARAAGPAGGRRAETAQVATDRRDVTELLPDAPGAPDVAVPPTQFGSQMRRSVAWSAADVGVSRFGQFALGVIVARILMPKDFGVFAVALVVHAVVFSISDFGVSSALIRDEVDDRARAAPTVAMIAVVSSFVLGVLMAVSAPLLANLLGSPKAAAAIAVMALNLPLAGLAAVPAALMRRDFRMDKIFVADTANTVATGIVVLLLATAGWGPMALAWSWVAGQALSTVVFMFYKPGRFWPGWDRSEARRLLHFGIPLAGANIVSFTILNVDFIIVGRALGAAALGLYVLAFNISGWPMSVFGSIIRSVSLPAFAKLQRDGEEMPEQFAKALRLVASVTLPVCLLLGALARPLVLTVYGHKWSLAATALVFLSLLGAARVLIELMGDFLITLGRTRAVFLAQLPWFVGLVAALIIGVRTHGIAGAGAAQAIISIGLMIPIYLFFLRRCGVSVALVARALWSPLFWSLAAAVVAYLVARTIPNTLLACAAGGAAGLLVYTVPNLSYLREGIRAARAGRSGGAPDPDPGPESTVVAAAVVGGGHA